MPLSSHSTQYPLGSCRGLSIARYKIGFVTPLMASDQHWEGRKDDECQFLWFRAAPGSVEGPPEVCLGVKMRGKKIL